MMKQLFKAGDWVIYRKTKHSTHPGPRAQDVQPSENGDDYSYLVDKFWAVAETRDEQTLVLVTRTGKLHVVSVDDPHLRHANWWERFRYRQRFPKLSEAVKGS